MLAENTECIQNLRLTDPRDDKKRIENTKGGLLRDSYKWILQNHDFQHWRDNYQNPLLWIRGDPGKGKTMLLCGILDELRKTRPNENISYFFCQATDADINTATAVLRGLIFLLVDQQPSLIAHVRDRYDQAGKQLFEDANVWVALSAIFNNILQDPNLRPTYLVIDALDECLKDLPQLLDLIIQISTVNGKVKWIVSSRNWPSIEEKLDQSTENVSLRLELNSNSISAAVRAYIRHKVDQLAREKKYDQNLQDYVNQYLSLHADNTFLWVALVCQELARPGIQKRHTKAKLQTLPPGLEPLYRRMIQQIHDSEDEDLCLQILAVVSLAYRPITVSEMITLIDTSEIDDDPEILKEIVQLCGSFLTLRGDIIFFVHQSARDFLSDKEPQAVFSSGKEVKHQSIFSKSIDAMSKVLKRDIYNLEHPGTPIEDIERQCPYPDPLAPLRYASVHWIDHFLETQNVCDNVSMIDAFLREHFLHWFEALSLLKSTSSGVLAMLKLVTLLQVRCYKPQK